MTRVTMFLLAFLFLACGQNNSTGNKSMGGSNFLTSTLSGEDSDGDMVSDEEEKKRGRNSLVADIPSVNVQFMGGYKITVKYEFSVDRLYNEERYKYFTLDTETYFNEPLLNNFDNPQIKPSVGELFIRGQSFKNAAKIGQAGHLDWGILEEHDLSWVSYPKIDPSSHLGDILPYEDTLKTNRLKSLRFASITFESSVRLEGNREFRSIKDLFLNFRYYDYEKESFELLAQRKLEGPFDAGVTKSFEVSIESVPLKLIEENYLRRGEFIIVEVENFYIPDLDTTYQNFMASVRAKSLPVVINTPDEKSVIHFVATGEEGADLNTLLGRFREGRFTIREEGDKKTLQRIDGYENNLPEYTDLSEIRDKDEEGKWFVLTNKIPAHHLEYKYTPENIISLSFVRGEALTNQVTEETFSYLSDVSSSDEDIYFIGNISSGTSVHMAMDPKALWGEKHEHYSDYTDSYFSWPSQWPLSEARQRLGNSVLYEGSPKCRVEYSDIGLANWGDNLSFKQYPDTLFDIDNKDFSAIMFVIDGEEFPFRQLVDEGKVLISFQYDNLILEIPNVSDIKEISNDEEKSLFLKLVPRHGINTPGINLVHVSGTESEKLTCFRSLVLMSYLKGIPVTKGSMTFDTWKNVAIINQNPAIVGRTEIYKNGESIIIEGDDALKISKPRPYTTHYVMDISSVVIKRFH